MPDPAYITVYNLIIRCGSHRFSDAAEVYNALVIVRELKALGHAVVMNETYDDDKKFVEAYVLHYKTCRACQRGKDVGTKQQTAASG